MTKKDYKIIATAIRNWKNSTRFEINQENTDLLIANFSQELLADNPLFSREKVLQAIYN